MDSFRHVLVGVDFTGPSRAALAHAIRLARAHGAHLHVVHVIEEHVVGDLADAVGLPYEQIAAEITQDATADLERELPQPLDVAWDAAVEIGVPLAALLRAASDVGADLVVLGDHGATTSAPGLLASRVVRRATVPVLVVREGHPGRFANVAVGVDFSESSRVALRAAADLVKSEGGVLHAVHVFQPPWEQLHYRAPTPQAAPDFVRQYRDRLRSRLEHEAAELAGADVRCHLVEHPRHGTGLVEWASGHGADLLVVGARGRTNLPSLLLGSTAERVLREAHCAVLAVKG